MTPERAIINKALWAHRPTTEQGKAVLDLVALCERLLAGRDRPASADDEPALRREIDDGCTALLLVWADLLDDKGEDPAVTDRLRQLAREGKRPGTVAGLYRWSAERPEFGGVSSWTLPAEAVVTLQRKSTDLGGKEKGRFATLSASMAAAARVMASASAPPPVDEHAVEYAVNAAFGALSPAPAPVAPPEMASLPCRSCDRVVPARLAANPSGGLTRYRCPFCHALCGTWIDGDVQVEECTPRPSSWPSRTPA